MFAMQELIENQENNHIVAANEIGKATKEQINYWKRTNPLVYEFSVELDDNTHYCYLTEPPFDKFAVVAQKAKTDETAAALLLINTCWLGGDEAFKNRIKLITGLAGKIGVLTESKQAQVKKL